MPLLPKEKLSLCISLIISSATLTACVPDIILLPSNNKNDTIQVEYFAPENPSIDKQILEPQYSQDSIEHTSDKEVEDLPERTSQAAAPMDPHEEEAIADNITKVELNYIDSVALYENKDGRISERTQLNSVPENVNDFYVVINGRLSKPVYVKVKKFEQVEHNKEQVIKAQLDLEGLIHRENSSVADDDFVYIPMTAKAEDLNKRSLDLETLPGYQSEKATAYANMTRLLPFYNREKFIYYGNKVPINDPLYSKPIRNVIPMTNDQFVIDVKSAQTTVNKLFVLFADNSHHIYDLTGPQPSPANSAIVEYQLGGSELIYTPNTFITDNSEIINAVRDTFQAIAYNSKEVAKALGNEEDFGKEWFNTRLKRFRLEEGFNSVKQNIELNVSKILAADGVVTTSDPVINRQYIEKLNNNAAEILLGLSYLQRWYDIDFGSYNIRDLTTFKLDFCEDKNISTLDVLINLGKNEQGKIDWGNILPIENVKYYKESLSQYTDAATLFEYLEKYRQLFLAEKTNNQWLVDSSKAHIVEELSTVKEAAELQKKDGSETSIGVYDRIKNSEGKKYQHMLLPLLTLKDENMYVIATMGALSVGGYEPYSTQLTEEKRKEIRALVNETAKQQRNVFDFWYKILNEEDRKKMFQNMLNYDTFLIDGKWQDLDAQYSSIQQFFGPVEIWKNHTNASAYALYNDKQSFFFQQKVLGTEGTSTFSHEMVHLFDQRIYLSGHGRRPGMGSEAYAEGLFETTYTTSDYIGFNQAFIGQKDDTSRYHVADPTTRFQNEKDLQGYMSGMFDVLYLLEYLEGQAMVAQPAAVKTQLLRKVENIPAGNHAINNVGRLSASDASNLQNFDDLVRNNIITARKHTTSRVHRNAYNVSYYSASNWAALSNEQGAPGGLMFKRMAMELLAEKGYYEGMLPYISDMLKENTSSNSALISYNVTDQKVFDHVFAGEGYTSWSDFKIKMYQQRAEKAKSYLRPVTIQYDPENLYGTNTVTIRDFNDLKGYFDQAVQKDAQNSNSSWRANQSYVGKLKEAIYKAYLDDTDDFRKSIFEKSESE